MDKSKAIAAQKKRPKRTLKTIVIEPFKQIKLGIYVMLVTLGFIVVAGYFYRQAFEEQYAHVMEIFGVVEEATREQVVVNDIFLRNRIKLAVVFVAYVGLMFWVIFRTTHKYYGPLVSIERFVKHMIEGNYSQRVSIRKGDELGRLVELLNDMAKSLQQRHGNPIEKRDSNDRNNQAG
jgi:hypothetical protein